MIPTWEQLGSARHRIRLHDACGLPVAPPQQADGFLQAAHDRQVRHRRGEAGGTAKTAAEPKGSGSGLVVARGRLELPTSGL